MLNLNLYCLENSVDQDHHNVMVEWFLQIMMARHAILKFTKSLTNEKLGWSKIEIWEFLTVDLEKRYLLP